MEQSQKIQKGQIKTANGSSPGNIAEYLALVPGLFMCAMLLIELVLDICSPAMAEGQFEVFPDLFTVLDYLTAALALIYLVIPDMCKEFRSEKTDYLFAGFALLIVASTCVNGFNEITVDGVPYRFIGIFNMFAFMLIYMGVSRSIRRDDFADWIMLGFLAVADLIGSAALIDLLTGGIAAFDGKKELSAIFFNGNHYGYFLLMASLIGIAYYLFETGKLAIFGASSAGLNLILLAINHSLGSILALIVVLVVTAILIAVYGAKRTQTNKRQGNSAAKSRNDSKNDQPGQRTWNNPMRKMGLLAGVLLAAFIAAFLISPALRKEFTGLAGDIAAILGGTADGSAGHRRLQMWTLAAGYIAQRPLLGYGCEGIAFMLYEAMQVSHPHSEVLSYAAFYGIPAAALYLCAVAGTLLASLRRIGADAAADAPKSAKNRSASAATKTRSASAANNRAAVATANNRSVGACAGSSRKAACMAAAGYFISSFVGVSMFYTLPFFFIFLGIASRR